MTDDDMLNELLKITAAGPSYDEAKARRAVMKIVAAAERFRAEAHYVLLKPRDSWADDRHGLKQLIDCTSNWLKEMGAGRDELDQLTVYSTALGDLDDEIVHSMFKVNNGNPALGSQKWRLRGMSAVALDYLVGAGDRVDDAAKRLAKMRGFEKLRSGRAISVDEETHVEKSEPYKSVKRWRKAANSGGDDLDETFKTVWEGRQPPGSVSELEFRKLAARQMDKIRDELGTIQADL